MNGNPNYDREAVDPLLKYEVYSLDSSKMIGNFAWSLELQPVIFQAQPSL